ncbi:flavin reductase family protein [Amycolatopsis jejuensis]|uniref:flavin reductase family protein n=1 Tax=Amycolatopsis jejuensis TaxID=330084 RepID=UPI0007C5CD68|nr:flavin reductase family protein [Amycolatopsis jejuensis]
MHTDTSQRTGLSGVSPGGPDHRRLRRSLGQFATGVTVVTYELDGAARGITVNSFTSVSMDPPLVLVSLALTSKAAQALDRSGFVVNILAAEQEAVAKQFCGTSADSPAAQWETDCRIPRLAGTVAWIECEPHTRTNAGDHVLVLGRVVDHLTYDRDALVFQSGRYRSLPPEPGSGD